MIDFTQDQYLHLRKKVFPPLLGRSYSDNEIFIQEKDNRLTQFLIQKLDAVSLDPKICTLETRNRSIKELSDTTEQEVLSKAIDLVGRLRKRGIVSAKNEHFPLVLILFNWAADALHYAALSSPNNSKLNFATEKLVFCLSLLFSNGKKYEMHHQDVLSAIESINRTIEECIPEEEAKEEGYADWYIEVLKEIDTNKKRWFLQSSPWLMENWANQKKAPFSSRRDGFTILYRCCQIARSRFEPMVLEHCSTTLKFWRLSVSQMFAFFRRIRASELNILIKEDPFYQHSPVYAQLQYDNLAKQVMEWSDTLREYNNRAIQILESLVVHPKLGDLESVSLLNPLGNITMALLRKFNEIQKIIHDVGKERNSLSSTRGDIQNWSFDPNFESDIMLVGTALTALNSFVMTIFGWSIAAEQQPLKLTETDQQDFLPPGLKAKGPAKAKVKAASMAKRKVEVISAPKKEGRQLQLKGKKHLQQSAKPKLAVKGAKPQPSLPLPKPENRQLAPLAPVPDFITAHDKGSVEKTVERCYERPFESLIRGGDGDGIKTAIHADLAYNLIKGLLKLNQSVFALRQDELFFISKSAMHTANLFMEAGIKQALIKGGFALEGTSHNLWVSFRKLKLADGKETVKRHYVGSYWARFMREQIHGWTQTAKTPPKLLRKIVELADGAPKALSKAQHRVDKWIRESVDFNNGLITQCLGGTPVLSIPKVENTNALPASIFAETPWLPLLAEVEKLADCGNVWIRQWLDEIKCLQGAWRFIDEANTPDEHALVVSAVHGLLHAAVQAPLYAMQVADIGERFPEHRLEVLWKEVFGASGKIVPALITRLLNEASVASRYPFNFDEPRSELHRLQLESIALLSDPDIEAGFIPANGKSIPSAALPTMALKNIRPLAEQKEALKSACNDIAQAIARELLPEVRISLAKADPTQTGT